VRIEGETVARAAYDFDGFTAPLGGAMSSGELGLARSDLKPAFGRPGVQLLTDDGPPPRSEIRGKGTPRRATSRPCRRDRRFARFAGRMARGTNDRASRAELGPDVASDWTANTEPQRQRGKPLAQSYPNAMDCAVVGHRQSQGSLLDFNSVHLGEANTASDSGRVVDDDFVAR
jgi:hypothetical protein